MIPKLKLFAWKLIRRKIPTRRYLRTIEMDINGDFPFFVKTSGRHWSSLYEILSRPGNLENNCWLLPGFYGKQSKLYWLYWTYSEDCEGLQQIVPKTYGNKFNDGLVYMDL